MPRTFLPLVVLLFCAACGSNGPASPDGPIDVRLVLAPGQTADVSGASFRLRFDGVMGDSRCPADALCIQGGDAIVRIRVLPDRGADASYDLHTGILQPARHDDATIALVELSPYPFNSRGPIAPGDYRATLRVTR